ncbi:unnamed protein product [Lampetra fluviatilis]
MEDDAALSRLVRAAPRGVSAWTLNSAGGAPSEVARPGTASMAVGCTIRVPCQAGGGKQGRVKVLGRAERNFCLSSLTLSRELLLLLLLLLPRVTAASAAATR